MGTQNIKAQVHLVNTDKAEVGKHFIWRGLVTKMLYDGRLEAANFSNCIPQHLYFTKDEEIKEDDPILYLIHVREPKTLHGLPILAKYNPAVHLHKKDCVKIVATTNPELWDIKDKFQGDAKTISHLIPNSGIPKIDTPFIEAYIKAYNEGNPIKEVLLETTEITTTYISGINTQISLKLKPNGSVIVHPIKEMTYSKEQVRRMLMGFNPTTKSSIARIKEVEDYIDAYYPE